MHPVSRLKTTGLSVAALAAMLAAFGPAAFSQAQPASDQAQAPAPASVQTSASETAATAFAAGVVRTVDGSPIPGASLRLVNTDARKAFVSWTDESGKFQFSGLPPGHYTVEASQLGFQPATIEVQLSGEGPPPPPLQMTLRVATLAELSGQPGPQRPGGRRLAEPDRSFHSGGRAFRP